MHLVVAVVVITQTQILIQIYTQLILDVQVDLTIQIPQRSLQNNQVLLNTQQQQIMVILDGM